MNKGTFGSQINLSWQLLCNLSLEQSRNYFPDYPSYAASRFRTLSYAQMWEDCFKNQFFNFQLTDNSLIQFHLISVRPLSVSYSYLECPFDSLTYRDYLLQAGFDLEEVGESFRSDYEQYLTACGLKETVTPIRYDFEPAAYSEGLHPASHVHFGHINDIRVGTQRILKPISFILFILRQIYPRTWEQFHRLPDADQIAKHVRNSLSHIDAQLYNKLDTREMMLT